MRSTKATRSLKNLFAGYHEPAPLSRKKTQALLDGLKSSFRDQLDREYGRLPSSGSSGSGSGSNNANPARHPSSSSSSPHSNTRQSAANQHLKALLSNPLFSYEKEPTSSRPSPAPTLRRDPMDVFDHAVSRGMMTLKAAAGCLVAKQQQIQLASSSDSSGNASTAAAATAYYDAGLRVVRWLRSSRPDSDMDFLDNKPFVRALVPFLVAGGLDHVAWEWVARNADESSSAADEHVQHQRASFLLAELVRVKSQPQNGNLDEAIATIIQAGSAFGSNPRLSNMLLAPWRSVSWLSTVESYRRTAPSEGLFDAHVETAARLPTSLDVEKAHLHLYHPTRPDHTPALRLFEDTAKVKKLLQGFTPASSKHGGAAAKSGNMGLLQWTAVLGHDTVNFLTRSGRSQEAEHVTGLLQYELASLFVQGLKPAS
ncbi:hypothetical protein GMORB2_5631 [Geosmithia morbida]|uniref:Uncharacterized protein n=1 Tax=Geosmithia morbida TaxID=1094350 RepID=A0A9P4YW29_9HYPO|nr:uncharacterized protein GMORB2_5631 [Geosmithia morbida]KAF4123915.1 hypothetical protein GMORB2_5631 [Geosmithia morbida]